MWWKDTKQIFGIFYNKPSYCDYTLIRKNNKKKENSESGETLLLLSPDETRWEWQNFLLLKKHYKKYDLWTLYWKNIEKYRFWMEKVQ